VRKADAPSYCKKTKWKEEVAGLELSCEPAKQMLSQLRYTLTKETVFMLKHFNVDRISVHSLETVKHRKCRSYCAFDSFSLPYPALAGRAHF
jgi:hypothetical protein